MATLTLRKVPDECVAVLKQAAQDNNRSMESEVRSVLEEYTAQYITHHVVSNADLVQEMWCLLDGDGLDEDEELVPPRNTYDVEPRPIDFGDDDDRP
ncbi:MULTISPECIES: FitA-like ribbon-helix-helix domain-containing protein [Bifidobacterium]|jgi:plasmid stability protein|nr:DNA-binding protein [Bifidobacterium tibiigranuli]MCH3973743.1 DNA-binding protein [Bifidobacterium tibiigranuli]MCH4204518.1 DNA-binding protein [Bifidobacterium tibiigranuli]MCH4275219.1 DNA-binding protein [Bifidobacterium tibiigranuli]MCI1211448.1 DNA-binding protein [Bifidobacterium tibiigranuli]MCI1221226.1 DNA-binding protein [Bifidobacterium tibiigranuli]